MEKDYYIIGIDEVGRGPVAGPVAVGVVAYKKSDEERLKELIEGVNDSKKISAKKREVMFEQAQECCSGGLLRFCIGFTGAGTIDSKGISYSIKKSLESALEKIDIDCNRCELFLDGGLVAPEKYKNQHTIIGGDGKEFSIALASIVAKVSRDRKMIDFSREFPEYGFEKHKGYGTRAHMESIKKFGMSKIHRISFLKNLHK